MAENEEGTLIVEKSEGRRKCPKCGEDNRYRIKEEVDKSRILLHYPRIYGKRFHCGRCGCIWSEK